MELIQSISVENTVAKRDGAVQRLRAVFAAIEEADSDISQLCGDRLVHLVGGNRDCKLFEGESGIQSAIKVIDAGVWAKLLLESGIRSFMSTDDRQKWDKKIHNHDVPEITLANVQLTFSTLYAARGEMFIDGVVSIFRALSWHHLTNSPMAFGKKAIIAGLWTAKGECLSDYRCNTLDDVVRAMHVLDGKPEPDVRNGMRRRINEVSRLGQCQLEDDYLTLRWYRQAGTAHITFKREDLVERMNKVLGCRFPDAIATDIRNPFNRPKPVATPALRSISEAAINALNRLKPEANSLVGLPQLDRQVYDEVNRVLQCLGGVWSRSVKGHVFDGVPLGNMKYVLSNVLRHRTYADPADFGYFPSPQAVVDLLIELAELKPGMRVLEPSAGRGAIVRRLLAEGCTVKAVELMESNLAYLHAHHCSVSQANFLEMNAVHEEHLFDAVVMNPPFAKHQDIAHVMHAMHFLKPGARLVAVMSASVKFNSDRFSTEFRQYVADFGYFVDLPALSFRESGTDVNTVIAVINKPNAAKQIATASNAVREDAQLALA